MLNNSILERIAIKREKQSAQAELNYWTQVQQARQANTTPTEEVTNETSEQPNNNAEVAEAVSETSENNTNDLNDTTKATEEINEPQPIGVGAFGNIYNQFIGKAKEAIRFLLGKKSGEAIGALHHKDIGDIDLVWGYEGTGKSDGFGLYSLLRFGF